MCECVSSQNLRQIDFKLLPINSSTNILICRRLRCGSVDGFRHVYKVIKAIKSSKLPSNFPRTIFHQLRSGNSAASHHPSCFIFECISLSSARLLVMKGETFQFQKLSRSLLQFRMMKNGKVSRFQSFLASMTHHILH